ncbi:TIGR04222 domain-containing membrane protein [Streptomyces sp. NPDC089424]|uniref:TIGR04222 domain-containing membrane protein n=1 Tax=Streptomyces sp. NPDC089424 TaxID=3365917 RepID=UPI0038192E4A
MSDHETRTRGPGPHELGMLRGGPRGAVTVAVLGLHLRGLVEAGRPGTLRRAAAFPAPDHPLEKAVRVGLYRPAGISELPTRAAVRLALARMREDLVADGLLRSGLPGPTRRGRRHLTALRARHPLPPAPDGLTDEEMLLAVALHGGRALTALAPHFTRASGLDGRGTLADEGRFPFGRGTDLRRTFGAEQGQASEGGGHGCGGGGGGGGGD